MLLGVNPICVLCYNVSAVLALLLMLPSVHGLLPEEVGDLFPLLLCW